jgi:hypothetical protein
MYTHCLATTYFLLHCNVSELSLHCIYFCVFSFLAVLAQKQSSKPATRQMKVSLVAAEFLDNWPSGYIHSD